MIRTIVLKAASQGHRHCKNVVFARTADSGLHNALLHCTCRKAFSDTARSEDDGRELQKHSAELLSKPLWYYNNKGIRMRKVQQLLRRTFDNTSTMTASEEESRIRNCVEFLSHKQISREKIGEMLMRKPRLLELSRNKLMKRFKALELKLDLADDKLIGMVQECPGLLLVDLETSLDQRLRELENLKAVPKLTEQKAKYVAIKCPNILLLKDFAESYAKKVENFRVLGFNPQQIYEIIMKHPAVLTYSAEAVRDKVELVLKMGGRLALFVKFPRVFTASVLRLQERHGYLLKEGYLRDSTRLSESKLRAIVLTTDTEFVRRVTNTKMKDFREFQREHRVKSDSDVSEEAVHARVASLRAPDIDDSDFEESDLKVWQEERDFEDREDVSRDSSEELVKDYGNPIERLSSASIVRKAGRRRGQPR